MAEIVLGALLNVLLDKVASRNFIDLFKTQKMDMGLLERLETLLITASGVLDDAEDRQITSEPIKKWLVKLRDVAYEADDLLGEFYYEVTRLKVEAEQQTNDASARVNFSEKMKKKMKKSSRRVKHLFIQSASSSTGVNFAKNQQDKMKQIVGTLDCLVNQSDTLGLKEVKKYAPSERPATTAIVDESAVFGRDEDKESIFELLLANDGRDIGVIPIVGMGGIGKTTLAQLVYNDSRSNNLFVLKVWVCVSENYDGFKIKREILKHIDKSVAYDHLTPNLIDEKLWKSLKDKKYLLVLDDVWNDYYDDWNRLLTPLKSGARGSKIIVTTRNREVASTVSVDQTSHDLHILDDEYCWQLFVRHVFEGGKVDQKLEVIGKKILSKCRGLPLAAKMLAGLLRGKRHVRDWNRILNSNIWDLPQNNVLPALRLSYQHLSSQLKQCFSYLAIFPKDYEMTKEEIIRLWMAEGFLVQNGAKEMEELGEEWFDELVSRCFLQEKRDEWNDDDYTVFCMHDLINDLAKYIAGEVLVRMEGDNSCELSKRNRHLSYLAGKVDSSKIEEAISMAQALRTFLTLYSCGDITKKEETAELLHNQISKMMCLRVLSLRGIGAVVKLPDLCNLKHLRHLDFAETDVERLPESLCTLYNLQILILCECNQLVELPKNMRNLINLRCLDIRETPKLQETPLGMGNLKELRTLSRFFVGKQSGAKIDDLGELRHLHGELSIFNLENVMEIRRDVLKNKEKLEDLELVWNSDTRDSEHENVLEKLRPCASLKKLSICGYGGTKFANWVGDSSYMNIVSLKLRGCKYVTSLPPLGQLSSLEDLSIKEFDAVVEVGVEFSKMPFSFLKTLKIEDMNQWEDWVICEKKDSVNCESFPMLEKLILCNCSKLKSISTCEPTHKIFKSLNQLDVKDCPNLRTSNILAVSIFKELKMKGKGREVHLKQLPSEMYRLKVGLSYLDLLECNSLMERKECNSVMEGNEEMLILFNALDFEAIEINGNKLLQSIPLEALPKLHHLSVEDCDKLETLSASEDTLHQPLLASLEIIRCRRLISFPKGGITAPNLTRLILSECSNLKSLPQYMHNHFQSLEHLEIKYCEEIESFPEGGLPANLQSLEIGRVDKIFGERLKWGLQNLNALSHLSLGGYDGDDLDCFPEQTLLPSSLDSLQFCRFKHLKFINYQGLQHLTSPVLKIEFCPEIESFPKEGLPSNLQSLEISGCDKLIRGRMNWGLQRLYSLSKLCLSWYKGDDLDSFPEQTLLPPSLSSLKILRFENLNLINYEGFRHLTSLTKLEIWNCPNLQSFPEEGFQHLTSLAELEIETCPKLQSLPKGLPSSLSVLKILRCPLVEKRCERDKGEDWPKISHISTIKINGRKI